MQGQLMRDKAWRQIGPQDWYEHRTTEIHIIASITKPILQPHPRTGLGQSSLLVAGGTMNQTHDVEKLAEAKDLVA